MKIVLTIELTPYLDIYSGTVGISYIIYLTYGVIDVMDYR